MVVFGLCNDNLLQCTLSGDKTDYYVIYIFFTDTELLITKIGSNNEIFDIEQHKLL